MELFLNEWSASPLAKDGCFMKECDPFRFFGLLTKLKGKGVLKVYLPQEVRRRFFQTCFAMGDGELENLARSFKPLLETDRLGNALYAMSVENDSFCSIHAGISWKRQQPIPMALQPTGSSTMISSALADSMERITRSA